MNPFRILALGLLAALSIGASAQTVFSGSDATTTTALDDFRAAIGGANNGPGGTAQATGRREVNWDGVRLDGTDANPATQVLVPGSLVNIPTNRFAARGLLTATPYAISNDGFGSINPSIAGQVSAFSPANTFAMANNHRLRMSFLLPGTNTAGGTRGFGAIFHDVELAGETTMEMFNGTTSLGVFDVATSQNGGTSFLGVLFNDPRVTNVTLTLGNANLFTLSGGVASAGDAENIAQGIDLAVTDDFIYAEPAQAVPEPATMVALAAGAAAFVRRRIR